MTIALWILNILLALAFFAAGAMKALRPKPALQQSGLAWVEDFSPTAVKTIGVLEVLGALGLVLPLATGIVPVLTPIAAVALTVTMLAATLVHVRRRESGLPSIVLAVLSGASAVIGFVVVLG